MTEERTSGGPSTRFSRLEHHWSIDVPAGNFLELHVEGFRTVSPDGDDFVLEYSTDGGSGWNPIALPSLPLADDGVDLAATLPSNLAGTVLFRIIDTDHVAGNDDLDSVFIDELFVRSVP